ncbi:hypothetical protein T01_3677 [Trichinella spiralis]|uniref:Uncharacterized protein n=1 Tax=Trichinella spiralis TaxID=6334 RepID=A0A0V1AZP8_TRISP|nr:hypothetical protein T01_3677 [Trichinella spiralis]
MAQQHIIQQALSIQPMSRPKCFCHICEMQIPRSRCVSLHVLYKEIGNDLGEKATNFAKAMRLMYENLKQSNRCLFCDLQEVKTDIIANTYPTLYLKSAQSENDKLAKLCSYVYDRAS